MTSLTTSEPRLKAYNLPPAGNRLLSQGHWLTSRSCLKGSHNPMKRSMSERKPRERPTQAVPLGHGGKDLNIDHSRWESISQNSVVAQPPSPTQNTHTHLGATNQRLAADSSKNCSQTFYPIFLKKFHLSFFNAITFLFSLLCRNYTFCPQTFPNPHFYPQNFSMI